MWKENRFGWPLRGIIWFTVAIAGSCAVIALLAGYVQKTKFVGESHPPSRSCDDGLNMQVTQVRIRPVNKNWSRPMLPFASTTALWSMTSKSSKAPRDFSSHFYLADISTDLDFIVGAAVGDKPTGICRRLRQFTYWSLNASRLWG